MSILLLNDKQVGVIETDFLPPPNGIVRQVDSNGKLIMPTNSFVFSLPASITSISSYKALDRAFYGCTGLSAVSLPNLTSITNSYAFQYAFYGCGALGPQIFFPNLSSITGSYAFQYAFQNAFGDLENSPEILFYALTSSSFSSYTNQFNNMLSGVTGAHVYFPSNLESVIGSWTDVVNGFGGTNTIVSFTLAATT